MMVLIEERRVFLKVLNHFVFQVFGILILKLLLILLFVIKGLYYVIKTKTINPPTEIENAVTGVI